jgi:hypothetical protein
VDRAAQPAAVCARGGAFRSQAADARCSAIASSFPHAFIPSKPCAFELGLASEPRTPGVATSQPLNSTLYPLKPYDFMAAHLCAADAHPLSSMLACPQRSQLYFCSTCMLHAAVIGPDHAIAS